MLSDIFEINDPLECVDDDDDEKEIEKRSVINTRSVFTFNEVSGKESMKLIAEEFTKRTYQQQGREYCDWRFSKTSGYPGLCVIWDNEEMIYQATIKPPNKHCHGVILSDVTTNVVYCVVSVHMPKTKWVKLMKEVLLLSESEQILCEDGIIYEVDQVIISGDYNHEKSEIEKEIGNIDTFSSQMTFDNLITTTGGKRKIDNNLYRPDNMSVWMGEDDNTQPIVRIWDSTTSSLDNPLEKLVLNPFLTMPCILFKGNRVKSPYLDHYSIQQSFRVDN